VEWLGAIVKSDRLEFVVEEACEALGDE